MTVCCEEDQSTTVVLEDTSTTVVLTDDGSIVVLEDTTSVITDSDTSTTVVTDAGLDNIVEVCKQGPPGPAGPPGTAQDQINATVLPHATSVVDTLPMLDYKSVKWLVTSIVPLLSTYAMAEVVAIHNTLEARHSTYGKIGDKILYSILVELNSANLELKIFNDENFPLEVSVVRLATEI